MPDMMLEIWLRRIYSLVGTLIYLLLPLLLLGAAIAVVATIDAAALVALSAYVPFSWTAFSLVILIFMVGTTLYAMRCRVPKFYGVTEIVVGVLFSVYGVSKALGNTIGDPSTIFAVAGALYIMVRGYDNIYRALSPRGKTLGRWDRIFFGKGGDKKRDKADLTIFRR